MNNFLPGTAVLASVNEYDYDSIAIVKYYGDDGDVCYTLTGVVKKESTKRPNHVIVLWDDNIFDFEETEIDVEVLTPASNRFLIEEEFKMISKQIEEKMLKAAELLNDAGSLTKKINIKSLQNMYYATQPLIKAMDKNGWCSSSWGC